MRLEFFDMEQLEKAIEHTEEHLRLAKQTQANHPHRAEEWDWIIEKHEVVLAYLLRQRQEII